MKFTDASTVRSSIDSRMNMGAPSSYFKWVLPVVALFSVSSLPAPEPLLDSLAGITLSAFLDRAVEAFVVGDFLLADELFDQLEVRFGSEPEFQDDEFQRATLPVRGYVALANGSSRAAVDHFERFLEKFGPASRQRRFVLFSLAQAYAEIGKRERALQTYQSVEAEYPGSGEAAMALLRRCEIQFELNRFDEAFRDLNLFYESEAAFSLRLQARLRALRAALDSGRKGLGAEILLQTEWPFSSMPEVAVLAFEALEAGDFLLDTGEPAKAIRAYRYVPEKHTLVALQERRLAGLRSSLNRRQERGSDAPARVWMQHYQGIAAAVESQLDSLKEAEDYTPAFLLRFGQAFLLAERYREAAIVFQSLAEDRDAPLRMRRESHYRWVLSFQARDRWDEALLIARDYLNAYPDSELAPSVLFLIAKAYQGQDRYEDAVEVLDSLIVDFPGHRWVAQWIFTRGFCRLLNGEYAVARGDFSEYTTRFSEGLLRVNAQLWHSLTYFYERDYDSALYGINALLGEAESHHLLPEIKYRRASVLYARREYEAALRAIDDFLSSYEETHRAAEARVLRGDILMGQGELMGAAVAFSQVTPEAGPLYPYAVFQTGKIHRAREDYPRMVAHFNAYVTRAAAEYRPRLSEALYWIGWAHDQMGRGHEALPIFARVLREFGNDRSATEILLTLRAFGKLSARLENRSVGAPEVVEDFEDWLQAERSRAMHSARLTYYSRLSLYLADTYRKGGRDHVADLLILEIVETVPLRDLDAAGLGKVGQVLAGLGFPSAEEHFETLLSEFPASSERAVAFYGLARIHFQDGEYPEALGFLERFGGETPTHVLAADAAILEGEILLRTGRPESAIENMEELLRIKSARGRPHARALTLIAQARIQLGELEKAIAYYQRVYSLYQAYPDLVALSYVESALIFEELGDLEAALSTLVEMLGRADLKAQDDAVRALAARDRLAARVDALKRMNSASSQEEIVR